MTEEEQAALIAEVRRKTTSDIAELPDAEILAFTAEGRPASLSNWFGGALDMNALIGECWEYIARKDKYMSETQGAVSASQPTSMRMANYYYQRSGKAGSLLTLGAVTRGDLGIAVAGSEHGA